MYDPLKKFLPTRLVYGRRTINYRLQAKRTINQPGFTLIELLVVISIIAILSVIGFAIYGTIQSRARDSRRKADIDAIASSMEANYNRTPAQYSALSSSFFSSNQVPTDPTNSSTGTACNGTPCRYCYAQGTTAPTLTFCPATGGNYIDTSTASNPSGGTNTYWVVCANLEGGLSYCRANSQ